MRRFATLTAALASGLALASPALAAEAAPIAADSPAATTGASPTTVGRGVTNDGTSATTSTTTPGTSSAPTGLPGVSDPSITSSTTTTLSPIPRNSGLVTAPGAGNNLGTMGGAVKTDPLGPNTVTPPLDQ